MTRRNYRTVPDVWPEWRLYCAETDCQEHAPVAGLVDASSGCAGWSRHRGLWYCPKHGTLTQEPRS